MVSGAGAGAGAAAGSSNPVAACMAMFQATDSILEPKIFETISAFIKEGGAPLQLVKELSASYVGLPDMCNLMSGWAREFDLDPIEIMQEVLKEQLMDGFNPESVDRTFMDGSDTPEWLTVMIRHPFWRSVIYELSEKHQKCGLLNFAIQRISDAGHQGEIASVATASTFVNVFSGVLLDSLDKLREEDDVGLVDRLPDLIKVCCQSEHTYLYTQVLLYRLMRTDRGLPLKRISKELETGVLEKFNKPSLVSILRMLLAGAPFTVANAISAILHSRIPSPGDVMALHKAYTSQDPPSAYFLRDPDFFEIMLSSVYVPSFKGGMAKQDHKDKYLWLVAYAASVQEIGSDQGEDTLMESADASDTFLRDTSKVDSTYQSLSRLAETLSKRTAGTDLSPFLADLLEAMQTPVASMALMYWLVFVIKETSYIETYFRSHEVLVPLLLLEEMASLHPLQQSSIFLTFVDFFEFTYDLNPEIMMTYRKSILDRMIVLMELNYVIPVLDYIQNRARKMDQSLTIHFVKKVLEMIQGPYTQRFVHGMGQITGEIVEAIRKTEVDHLVRIWLEEVSRQPRAPESRRPSLTGPEVRTSTAGFPADGGGAMSAYVLDSSTMLTVRDLLNRLDV